MSSMTTMEAWADPPGRECPMKGTHTEAPAALRRSQVPLEGWPFVNLDCKENYSTRTVLGGVRLCAPLVQSLRKK